MIFRLILLLFAFSLGLNAQATCTGCGPDWDGSIIDGATNDIAGYTSATAIAPLATGDFYWNSGLFVGGNLTVQDGSGNDLVVFSNSGTLFQNTIPTTGDTKVIIKEGPANADRLLEFQNNAGDIGWSWVSHETAQVEPGGGFQSAGGANVNSGISFSTATDMNATSGSQNLLKLNGFFTPTSGTATYEELLIRPTINQTGVIETPVTRGLYVNPILTLAPDFRGIEVALGGVHIVAGGLDVTAGTSTFADSANVASSATTALPVGNLFHITGTTTITTLNTCDATNNGRIVTLIFDGVLIFTDGNNLIISGNFVTATNSSINLTCDGTSWFENSRSIN